MTLRNLSLRRITVAIVTTVALSATFAYYSHKPAPRPVAIHNKPIAKPVLSDACQAATTDDSDTQDSGLNVVAVKVFAGRSITFRVTNPSVVHQSEDQTDVELIPEVDANGYTTAYRTVDSRNNGYWWADTGKIVANADGSFTYTAPIRIDRRVNKIDFIRYDGPASASGQHTTATEIALYVEDAPEDTSGPNESTGGEEYEITGTDIAPSGLQGYILPTSLDVEALGDVVTDVSQGAPQRVFLHLTKPEAITTPEGEETSDESQSPPSTGVPAPQQRQGQNLPPPPLCTPSVGYDEWHSAPVVHTGWKALGKQTYYITGELSGRIYLIYRVKLAANASTTIDVKHMTFEYKRWRWKHVTKCVNNVEVETKQRCDQLGIGQLYIPSWINLILGYPADGAPKWSQETCR